MFYYVAASIDKDGEFIGTNTIRLGNRIAVESISIDQGIIVVKYAERKPNSSSSSMPSIGITRKFIVNGLTLTELEGKS